MGKGKKIFIWIAVILAAIVIGIGGTLAYFFFHYYGKMNYLSDDDVVMYSIPDEDGLSPEEESMLAAEHEIGVNELDYVSKDGDFYNILLIGADRRDTSWNGNSDAMILITINNKKKTMYMTSFMRDLYANIEGVGVRKLNSAYAIGAGPLLVKTLRSNYGVTIDNYASVDFNSLEAIIDLCGGVDIEIKDYELGPMGEVGITTTGVHRLTGAQALRYSRIRYQGNADFERTSRQRTVLEAVINNARSLSVSQLMNLADAVLPLVTHNIEQGKVLSLLTNLPSYLEYNIEQVRVPFDGQYSSMNEILIPTDFNSTISQLQSIIYAVN